MGIEPVQDKVVASMPKQRDPEDPEVRQLPHQGLSSNAIRQRLHYKVSPKTSCLHPSRHIMKAAQLFCSPCRHLCSLSYSTCWDKLSLQFDLLTWV